MSNRINTKKLASILGIIFIVSGLITGALFYAEYSQSGFSLDAVESGDKNSNKVDFEESADLQGISEISIETSSSDISLISSDANEVKAHFFGSYFSTNKSYDPRLSVKKDGSRLIIKAEDSVNGMVLRFSSDLQLNVYIPSQFTESIKVKSSSGNVESDEFSLKDFTVKTSSGDIEFQTIIAEKAHFDASSGEISFNGRFKELNVNTSSGDIDSDRAEADYAKFESSSGSIRFSGKFSEVNVRSTSGDIMSDNVETAFFTLKTDSGNVTAAGSLANITAASTSGDITLTTSEKPQTIQITTNSGKTRLKLPDSSGFKLACKTNSGEIKSDFPVTVVTTNNKNDDELNGTVGDGSGSITITSTSGDINILN